MCDGIPVDRRRRSVHARRRGLRQRKEPSERRVRCVTLDQRTGETARARPATWPHLVQPRPAARDGNALTDADAPDGRPRFATETSGSRDADAPALAEQVQAVDNDGNVAGVALRVDHSRRQATGTIDAPSDAGHAGS